MEDSIKVLQELEKVVKPVQEFIARYYDSMTEVRVSEYGAEVLRRDSGTSVMDDDKEE